MISTPQTHIAEQTHVAIIGGGIAGLSAAWYLQQADIPYTIIEASDHWGGKIRTETVTTEVGVFTVEVGPDSFISQKPWARQLAEAVGIGDQLLGTNDDQREIFVLVDGRIQALPDGVMLIVPTRFMPFALTRLFSIPAKLRMGMEMFVPARQDDDDESLAEFVRRRLGNEALDKLAEPLMSGIYNTDAEKQSVMATFPRFRAMEKKYGSLTRGMLAAGAARRKAPSSGNSMFTSFKTGMQALPDAIVQQLTGTLLNQTTVEAIIRDGAGYQLQLSDGAVLAADEIIMSIPSQAAASLLQPITPEAANILDDLAAVSTGTVSLAYPKSAIPSPLKGFGVVVPRSEKRNINAVTVSSTKFNHRAPDDTVLMRVFFGGARTPHMMEKDDDEVLAIVREELLTLTGITDDPLFARIYRNHRANPQYEVGHLEQIAALKTALPSGITLAGGAYEGVGVPDCVHQGQEAATTVQERINV